MVAQMFKKYEYELLIFSFLIVKIILMPAAFTAALPVVSAIALCLFVSWILGKTIHTAEENTKRTVLIFTAFFLGSSVPNSVLFLNGFDKPGLTYTNALFVFCLLAAFACAGKGRGIWWTPLLCFAGIAAQPLFAFTYLPAIAVLLLYRFIMNPVKENKQVPAACAAAAAAALILFRNSLVFAGGLSPAGIISTNIKPIVYNLLILLPLILIFLIFWIYTIKKSIDKPFRLIVFFILLEPVFPLFALFFKNGFINAVPASLFVQFCIMAYFLYAKDKSFLAAFGKAALFFEKNLYGAVLILIYLAAFSFLKYNLTVAAMLAG